MKQLTLFNVRNIDTEKMYLAEVNSEPTVIYYYKSKIYDLMNEIELSENDIITNRIPFEKHLIRVIKQTHSGTVTFKFDFDLYKEKLMRLSKS